jgi:hypothetical protein
MEIGSGAKVQLLWRGALVLMLLMATQAKAAQAVSAPPEQEAPQRLIAPPNCRGDRAPGEIVVCGRREKEEPYRMPEIFRDESARTPETAWSTRVLDFDQESRDGDVTSGPNGYLAYPKKMLREWRAERKEIERQRKRLADQIEAAGK